MLLKRSAVCFLCLLLLAPITMAGRVLDEYVYADDPNYEWWVDTEVDEEGFSIYRVQMISGLWRDASEVDETEWIHWLNVYVPDAIEQKTALMIIGGGSSSSDPADDDIDEYAGLIAMSSGSVLVSLAQVPYQPLTFAGETEGRTEDAILAYSWARFLEDTTDTDWPAHLPMTRAAVRAMDTVQSLVADVQPSSSVDSFVVAGGSKRGWTTWLAAAAENGPQGGGRVRAILPIVIDMLNIIPSFIHHYDVYGFWAPAVHDYEDAGVMDHIGDPLADPLFRIVDPYAYLDRFTMQKFIVNSTGDQFFLPDSWQFYWDDLPGPKWLRYVPNTDHYMDQVAETVLMEAITLYISVIADLHIPEYSFSVLADGTIRLETGEPVDEVRLWQATNPDARDFRLDVLGPAYTSSTLTDLGGGVYEGRPEDPPAGWTAYLVEVEFVDMYTFSSGVRVTGATDDDPVFVSLFDVDGGPGSVTARWETGAGSTPARFRLRASGNGKHWHPQVIETLPGVFCARDLHPELAAGGSFDYELFSRESGGDWLLMRSEVIELPALARSDLAGAWPNPFNPHTTIRFQLAQAGAVRLLVYDAMGRRVRLLREGSLDRGIHEAVWDGLDDSGRPAGSGVYFARLEVPGLSRASKLVLLR